MPPAPACQRDPAQHPPMAGFSPIARLALLAGLLAGLLVSGAPALAQSSADAAGLNPPAPAGCTGPASATWLRVTVEGVRPVSGQGGGQTQGQVAITLYADDASRFLAHHGSLYVGRTKAVAPVTDACIFVPAPGVYALAIYHDANGNQIFDRNALGLPEEAYGFSNNPHTFFGLPSFHAVRLKVEKSGQSTTIRLHYP